MQSRSGWDSIQERRALDTGPAKPCATDRNLLLCMLQEHRKLSLLSFFSSPRVQRTVKFPSPAMTLVSLARSRALPCRVLLSTLGLPLLLVLLPPASSTPTPPALEPTAPQHCPFPCACSEGNTTVDCSERGLLRVPPVPARVRRLDLSGNLLGPMINESFEHLGHLEEIDLSRNGLQRVQLCTFARLTYLRRVDLHDNRLETLHSSLFADSDKIEFLDLSYNYLGERYGLSELVFQSTPSLKVLNISHNRISRLMLGRGFEMLTHLQELDLSNNPFNNATENAFESTERWDAHTAKSLDLSNCGLQFVHPQALAKVPKLRRLNLSGNSLLPPSQLSDLLKELHNPGLETLILANMSLSNASLFSAVTQMMLKNLDLSQNNISAVPSNVFINVQSLSKLDISNNLLTLLDEGFGDLTNLNELNISRCKLDSFSGSVAGRMNQLTVLDLSRNLLWNPLQVDLSALRQLQYLDLSSNNLRSVVLPGDTGNLQHVNFAENILTSLPSMPNMRSLRHFDAHKNNIQSLSAFSFLEADNIQLVNLSHNHLATIHYQAFQRKSPAVIDLSHNLLTKTQFLNWPNTKEVYINNNLLQEVDQQAFYGMTHLQVLDLRNNNISVLHDETFRFLTNLTDLRLYKNSLAISSFYTLFRSMQSLRSLDLGMNKLRDLNTSSFKPLVGLANLSLKENNIRVLPLELVKDLQNLATLDISGNPFSCSCDLLPLRDWLRSTKVEVMQRFDLNLTNTCFTPLEHRGKLVTMFEVGEFQCNTKLLYMVIFGSIGGLGIIVGVISSLVCHYYSKWSRKQGKKRDKDDMSGHRYHRHHKMEAEDNTVGRKENAKKVDQVRISKKADPYRKQDFVNGWLNSKQLTVNAKNLDLPPSKTNVQKRPARPPWPERLSGRGQGRDKAGMKDNKKSQGKKQVEMPPPMRWESEDRKERQRVHSVSEMVPMDVRMLPGTHRERSPSTVPLWDARYNYQNYPAYRSYTPRTSVDGVWAGRWNAAHSYSTWSSPRAFYGRDEARYHQTLPQPMMWVKKPEYGPEYPYRRRDSEEAYRNRHLDLEEAQWRARQDYPRASIDQGGQDFPGAVAGYHESRYPEQPQFLERRYSDYENIKPFQETSHRDDNTYRTIGDADHRHAENMGSHLDERQMREKRRDRNGRYRDSEKGVRFVDEGTTMQGEGYPGANSHTEGGRLFTEQERSHDEEFRSANAPQEGRERSYREDDSRARERGKKSPEDGRWHQYSKEDERRQEDDSRIDNGPHEPRLVLQNETAITPQDDQNKDRNGNSSGSNSNSKTSISNVRLERGSREARAISADDDQQQVHPGPSDSRFERRGSDYRQAMENPVEPKEDYTPSWDDSKSSEWL